MAIIETTRPAPFGAVVTFRIINIADTLRQNFVNASQARKTEKVLQRLSDAQLQDIGLLRGNINSTVKRSRLM